MEIGEFQKQFVILFFQEESNEIKVESNGFIWIRDSYFFIFSSLAKVMNGFVK